VLDDTVGLETGDSVLIPISVTGNQKPLRVTLCWTDYPGTMRASYICVNDLDLTVYSPTGTAYKGNVYSGGQSDTGGTNDSLNVEECTRINSPEVGSWGVMVKARNVPQGPQPFALAAIGVLEGPPPSLHDVGATKVLAPSDTVDSGAAVAAQAVVRNFGASEETFLVRLAIGTAYQDTATVTLAAGMVDTLTFNDWTGASLGTFSVVCSTELGGDENPRNDAADGIVVVRSLYGIAENASLPRVFGLDRAAPNPFGGTTAIRYALPRVTQARLSVYSATGALVRDLQKGVLKTGYYSAAWNGRDGSGRLVPSGIYLYRLEAGNYSATGKVLLSR
jgi:hypothetical protein